MADEKDKRTQAEKFREAAAAAETDDDEGRFSEVLRRVATAKKDDNTDREK